MKEASNNKKEELSSMQALIGKTIKAVNYDDTNDYGQPFEGEYTLTFTDGSSVSFSSSGDDATWTSMHIEGRP